MAKINSTAGRVRDFQCPPQQAPGFPSGTPPPRGLVCEPPQEAKATFFNPASNGNAIRITIGATSAWSWTGQCARARKLKTQVDEGRDPRVIKAEATAADEAKRQLDRAEQSPALDAWNVYIDARATKWSDRHRNEHHRMSREGGEPITRGKREGMSDTKEPGILRPLLLLPLSGITRDEVAGWLEKEAAKRPTHTRLAVSMLATFINWCANRPEYRDQIHSDACLKNEARTTQGTGQGRLLAARATEAMVPEGSRIARQNPKRIPSMPAADRRTARGNGGAKKWSDVDFSVEIPHHSRQG